MAALQAKGPLIPALQVGPGGPVGNAQGSPVGNSEVGFPVDSHSAVKPVEGSQHAAVVTRYQNPPNLDFGAALDKIPAAQAPAAQPSAAQASAAQAPAAEASAAQASAAQASAAQPSAAQAPAAEGKASATPVSAASLTEAALNVFKAANVPVDIPNVRIGAESFVLIPNAQKLGLGGPGIHDLTEFNKRFGADEASKKTVLKYWAVKDFRSSTSPISMPESGVNKFRIPCNAADIGTLSSAFGRYLSFLNSLSINPELDIAQPHFKPTPEQIELVKAYLAALETNSKALPCINVGDLAVAAHVASVESGAASINPIPTTNAADKYYEVLPKIWSLLAKHSKEGKPLNTQAIFGEYATITRGSEEVLEGMKAENLGAHPGDFNHDIAASVKRLMTFLKENFPKIWGDEIASQDLDVTEQVTSSDDIVKPLTMAAASHEIALKEPVPLANELDLELARIFDDATVRAKVKALFNDAHIEYQRGNLSLAASKVTAALSEIANYIDSLKARLTVADARIKELELRPANCEKPTSSSPELQRDLDDTRKKLDALKADGAECSKSGDSLRKDLEDARKSLASCGTDELKKIAELNKKVAELMASLEAERKKLAAINTKAANLERELKNADEDSEIWDADYKKLEGENKKLQAEIARLGKAAGDNTAKDAIRALELKLAAANAKATGDAEEIRKLKEELLAAEAMQGSNVAELKAKLSSAAAAAAATEVARKAEIEGLERELKRLNDEMHALDAEKNSLEGEVARLGKATADTSAKDAIKALQLQLAAARDASAAKDAAAESRMRDLEAQLNAARAKVTSDEVELAKIVSLEAELARLRESQAKCETDKNALTNSINEMNHRIEELKASATAGDKTADEVMKLNSEVAKYKRLLEEANKVYNLEVDGLRRELAGKTSELDALRKRGDDADSSSAALEAEIAELESKLNTAATASAAKIRELEANLVTQQMMTASESKAAKECDQKLLDCESKNMEWKRQIEDNNRVMNKLGEQLALAPPPPPPQWAPPAAPIAPAAPVAAPVAPVSIPIPQAVAAPIAAPIAAPVAPVSIPIPQPVAAPVAAPLVPQPNPYAYQGLGQQVKDMRSSAYTQGPVPTVQNIIDRRRRQGLRSGGGSKKGVRYSPHDLKPVIEEQTAWEDLVEAYESLADDLKSLVPEPPAAPITYLLQPFKAYIAEHSNEPINEAREALGLLSPRELELLIHDQSTTLMERIIPLYERALPNVAKAWLPVLIGADALTEAFGY